MKPILSKLPNAGTTIFTIMSALAAQQKAINLGQGFPDYQMNNRLIDLVSAAMQNDHNQYAHMNGVYTLREGIAAKMELLYKYHPSVEEEITITPGGTYAIFTALTSIIRQGDEVIVFEPAYDSYIPNIEINGGKAITIALNDTDFSINWDLVKSKISPATKAIIINSPHNPSGALLSENDMVQLGKLANEHNFLIISDEVYEHIVFDDQKHLSLLKYPGLRDRAFCCFSFGKVYHCTGWKVGYCIAPAHLMKEFRKVHQYNCFSTNTPVQYALSEFMQYKEAYLGLGNFLQQKRDYLKTALEGTGLQPLPSGGSYFQLYSYKNLSTETELEFAKRLVMEAGVATIPVSAFYQQPKNNQLLRFCFAKKETTLAQAAERLVKYFK